MKTQVFALSVALTWLFVLVPQAATVQAQGAEDTDSAKAAVRFQRAVELYREGSYEGALAEFSKAYQISPSYLVLYNIAQTEYALHNFVGAYKSLMQYLAEGAGEIPADRRAQVDEMTVKLVSRIAHVQISTNVTGADIRVDDVSVGTSPLPGPVPVNVGTRRVSASKAGSPEAIRVLAVAGRENVKVELQIDVPTVTSAKLAPSAVSSSASVTAKTPVQAASSRTGLVISLSTTAALAIGTGVCGYLALGAQKHLNDQVNTYPNTKNNIEVARTRSKNFGYGTDALGAATIISGGVALYFAISHGRNSPSPKSGKADRPIVVAPTLGGMVVEGSF
jgi:tetratricopeptide (TPR) repeat protein